MAKNLESKVFKVDTSIERKIVEQQIDFIKTQSEIRILDLDEIRALDILIKNLILLKEKDLEVTKNPKLQAIQLLNTEDLLAIENKTSSVESDAIDLEDRIAKISQIQTKDE